MLQPNIIKNATRDKTRKKALRTKSEFIVERSCSALICDERKHNQKYSQHHLAPLEKYYLRKFPEITSGSHEIRCRSTEKRTTTEKTYHSRSR